MNSIADYEPETHDKAMNTFLLCNDDGIHAQGIATLHRALTPLGKLHVVAPDTERSAAGHAITLSDPIKTIPIEKNEQHYGTAVSGTPADCVKLALCVLLKNNRPDLVVSGINLGSNTGISVLYSGTVSAATEAVIIGVPAIALSLCTYQDPQWEAAARVAQELIPKLLDAPPPPGILLNVNIPNLPYEQLKGIKTTKMGRSRFVEEFTAHRDPRGNEYFWLGGKLAQLDDDEDTDVRAVEEGYVAITPLQIDMTAHHIMDQIKMLDTEF